ncbi:MAG: hypothetical protein ACR2OG_01655 [Gemmatimonadaceae bacterium]
MTVLDAAGTPVSELRARAAQQGEFVRRRLLAEIDRGLGAGNAPADEPSRVTLARLLAALIPDSIPAIASSLQTSDLSDASAELQFSIFVALSDLPALITDAQVLDTVTQLLKRYLLAIDTDMAQAAWMAGDLLGDHWLLALALPTLCDVARGAQHASGREGAIHGLSHALGRASKAEQWKMVELLNAIATTDSEPSVRQSAEMAISSLRAR